MNIPPLPLGAACVAAAARQAGHNVEFLDLMFVADPEAALRNAIRQFRPEVIGISVRNIDDQKMEAPKFLLPPVRRIVQACRSLCDAPVVVGGAGYSIFPESALQYLGADIGVRGEGEVVFPAVLECIASRAPLSEIPGVYLQGMPSPTRSLCFHLDDEPLPDPASWIPQVPGRAAFWIPVQTQRGCPMDCSFCSTSAIEGRPIRRRSPRLVAAWMEQLVAAGSCNFHFVDNTFNLPPSYAKDLCREIIRRNLKINLWCIVYPKWIDTELVRLMACAGCREVSLGFESGSTPMLHGMHKRFTTEEVAAASAMFADAGIARRGFLLLGGPGESRQTVEESLRFADSLNLDVLKITVGLRIYPETPLATAAVADGEIAPGDDLLQPRFYLARGLRDWLPARIAAYKAARPWVM